MSGALDMRDGDRILYEITGETGVAGEFLQDGDVYVTWDNLDTKTPCMVKWNHCRKVEHERPTSRVPWVNQLHTIYAALCETIWDAYVDAAKDALAEGHDTTALGQAAQMAFLSCVARVAADLGTDEEALAGQAAACLREAKRNVPKWG